MISESDNQYLTLMKSNPDFTCFLQAMSTTVDEFDKELQEATETISRTMLFIFNTEQLHYNPSLSLLSHAHYPYNFNTVITKKVTSINHSESCSETDVSLHEMKIDQTKTVFRVMKVEKEKINNSMSQRIGFIRKKVKTMFHKYVISNLNSLLHQNTVSVSFKPLSKKLSMDLNLKESKRLAELSLRELIVSDNKLGLSRNKLRNLRILKEHKSVALDAYLNKKWKIVYEEFLESSELSKALNEMAKTQRSYAIRFQKQASFLLQYIIQY